MMKPPQDPLSIMMDMANSLKQLVLELAPKNRQSTNINFNVNKPNIHHAVRTQGRINQFLVSLETQCEVYVWFNASVDLTQPNTSWPPPDLVFSGPTGNPIPIPFHGVYNPYMSFAPSPNSSQPCRGNIWITYY